MTTPDAIALAYRETGEIAAREYPLRMAVNAGVATLVALFGYPLFAIVWWLAIGTAAALQFLAYRRYFRAPRASLSRRATLGFAALNVLNSAIFLAPAWIVVELDSAAGYFGAACLFAGALIHVTVHNANTFLIFASTAGPIVIAFIAMSALLSYRTHDLLPLLTVGVFMWALVASYLGRRKNISTLNEMTAAALKGRAAAQQASKAKSQFLAKMSHEFRTPLNGVLGMAQALRDTELNPAQRTQVETIIHSGDSLLSLLNEVLDYSQIESGELILEPRETDLAALVRNSAALHRDAAARKNVTLSLDVEQLEEPRLLLDAPRLVQCLNNLISNAVKFTDSGAVLIKAASRRCEDRADTAKVSLMVSDTGVGMSDEERARVFAAFEQGDNSITRRHGGAGLGLAVSLGIVRAMDGTLAVDSKPGAGTAFTLRFDAPICAGAGSPAVRRAPADSPAADAPETTRGEAPLSGARVLLVEDNIVNRQVVGALLRPLNVDVTEAENGAEALQRLAAERFDIVLMDLHMPVMDGLTATREIRHSGAAWASVPVIAITAAASEEDRRACFAAGINDFLPKPVKADLLASSIGRFLRAATGPERPAFAG
ncbi:response regulator [Amphiplicatus metriothermophilus]|uniref:histidine kinase n=1 Tax=Amphiplicatus metriothermophilus TaxID=1519374 RepID=A0A239PP40_9PROT|nr:response regulator [Amphiplicatus metriothermophilus]MBB5518810.1 signal transduction histidine kinase/CheY-like chemotaxis protein [Amphiplicatus metriothermophilus]SNT72035.1 Signal transduction histidine kinase [Amphiplicatus metriothermophilus]